MPKPRPWLTPLAGLLAALAAVGLVCGGLLWAGAAALAVPGQMGWRLTQAGPTPGQCVWPAGLEPAPVAVGVAWEATSAHSLPALAGRYAQLGWALEDYGAAMRGDVRLAPRAPAEVEWLGWRLRLHTAVALSPTRETWTRAEQHLTLVICPR